MSRRSDAIYGLDIFRSLAILFVLLGHTLEHSVIPQQFGRFGVAGILGVEIFFALSGYLIGGILLRLMDEGRLHNFHDVLHFWSRRWMRTLPMYLIALLLFLRFDYHGRHELLEFPGYWFFLQNLAWPIPDFFGLSWSLAVEEHFYLWFPLLFLIAHLIFRNSGIALVCAATTLSISVIAYRYSLPAYTDWNQFNFNSRMVVLSRLDSIMVGVIIAAINKNFPQVYRGIRYLTPLWAFAGLLTLLWYYVGPPWLMNSRNLQLAAPSIQALVAGLMLPWFASIKTVPPSWSGAFFSLTSKISYSLYLVHILAIIAINRMLNGIGLFEQVYPNAVILYPLYFASFYIFAWVTYSLIEAPFMKLRDVPLSAGAILKAASPATGVALALVFLA